jgi:ECF transporter S component (folate family)
MGDFVGAILFPVGVYFPGFTLTAFMRGVVFGLFLHKKQTGIRILGTVAVNQLILSLLLNTLWISLLYDSPYGALFLTRIGQCAVTGPVQFAVIGVVTHTLGRYVRKEMA